MIVKNYVDGRPLHEFKIGGYDCMVVRERNERKQETHNNKIRAAGYAPDVGIVVIAGDGISYRQAAAEAVHKLREGKFVFSDGTVAYPKFAARA